MNRQKEIIYTKIILILLLVFMLALPLYSQGPGGPAALPNAFAGDPTPPPGGGGGGNPITEVPLDTDAILLLIIAGLAYVFIYKRKKNLSETSLDITKS